MDITREYLQQQQALLVQARQDLLANLNANQGILNHIGMLLERLDQKEPSSGNDTVDHSGQGAEDPAGNVGGVLD